MNRLLFWLADALEWLSDWAFQRSIDLSPWPMYRITGRRTGVRLYSDEADGFGPVEEFIRTRSGAWDVDVVTLPNFRARRIPRHQLLSER